jgi:hypothetical protein
MGDSLQAIIEIIDDAIMHDALSEDELRTLGSHIYESLNEFKRQEGRKVAAMLRKGSSVRIRYEAKLTPRYILGTNATVVKINKTTATITLGHVNSPNDNSRFYSGQEIRCPLDALELEPDSRPKETP